MPRRIITLKEAALHSIAKKIQYWDCMMPEDPDTYLYLLSPFEILDHGLTQLVFDALIEHKTFLSKHIHLLFHPQLHGIDLSKCATFKLGDNVLKTLLKRCKKIKNLKISGRTRYSKSLLNMIPLQYPKLQSLSITHENLSDEFMFNVGNSCNDLVSFHSSACGKLKDSSYKYLGQVHCLKTLTLGNADHLSNETLTFILNSCKKLRYLALPMCSNHFEFMSGNDTFNSVRSLDLTLADTVNDESIEKIVTVFPMLTDICLSNCEKITNHSLKRIARHCSKLENLNISYSGIRRYSDDIKHLLMSIGQNLHSVDFSGISHLSVSLFGQYCPHLEKLYLNHCSYTMTDWISLETMRDIMSKRSLENHRVTSSDIMIGVNKERYSLLEMCPVLNTLQIDFQNMPSNLVDFELEAVLENGFNVASLGLIQVPNFNDDKLIKLSNFMNVRNLKHLNISGNQGVTMKGIWHAIESMDNLQVIEIRDCDIVNNEIRDLQNRIKRKGFDVNILAHN